MPELGRVSAHKVLHQNGGSDEISVAGLSGALGDAQAPSGHHTSHETGGGDVIAGAAPLAHKTSHQNGGSDEISVAGLSGALADAQTPSAHKTSHQNGGSDEISVSGLSGIPAECSGEGHIVVLVPGYSSITQGSWVWSNETDEFMSGTFVNNGAVQNDQINFKVFLAAGTYTMVLYGESDADHGIATVLVDGVSVGTIDMYSALSTDNVRKVLSGISVALSGLVTISLKMATKNGSSTGYYLSVSHFVLFRTA